MGELQQRAPSATTEIKLCFLNEDISEVLEQKLILRTDGAETEKLREENGALTRDRGGWCFFADSHGSLWVYSKYQWLVVMIDDYWPLSSSTCSFTTTLLTIPQ